MKKKSKKAASLKLIYDLVKKSKETIKEVHGHKFNNISWNHINRIWIKRRGKKGETIASCAKYAFG